MAVVNDAALAALNIAPGRRRCPKGPRPGRRRRPAHRVITDGFADIPSAPAPSVAALHRGHSRLLELPWVHLDDGHHPHHAVDAFKAVSVAVPAPNIRYSVSVWVSPTDAGFRKT